MLIDTIPQFLMLAILINDMLRLALAQCDTLLNEAVAAHHHMNGAPEQAKEVGDNLHGWARRPCDIEGPERLAASVIGVDELIVREVSEEVVRPTLSSMIPEYDCIIHGVAYLNNGVELIVNEPGIIQIAASQGSSDSETGKSIGVAHTEVLVRTFVKVRRCGDGTAYCQSCVTCVMI